MHYRTIILLLSLSLFDLKALAEESFESLINQTTLVELYTSQGCSSCPPADRFLSALEDDPRLWREIVPIAFHVDYWDYIGWEDPYASAQNGTRQQRYARHGNVKTVYTPGFVVAGNEWRGFFRRRELPTTDKPVGVLKITHDNGTVNVAFTPHGSAMPARITVALLGCGLGTEVARGENSGKRLENDFVMLSQATGVLQRQGKEYRGVVQLAPTSLKAPRLALAAWVTAENNPTPIQATGGWLTQLSP